MGYAPKIIKKYQDKEYETPCKREGGRIKSYGSETENRIVQNAEENRKATAKDIFNNKNINFTGLSYDIINRILNTNGLRARIAKKAPKLTEDNIKKRFEWA